MVMKRGKKDNKVLFIDATNECKRTTGNNKLGDKNIARIVSVFTQRSDEEFFSKLVTYDEVVDNNYNLSVNTYVKQEDTREIINIAEINESIKDIVKREEILREEIDRIISEFEEDGIYE